MSNLKASKDTRTVNLYDNVVNLRGIQKRNLLYIFMWIIYYAWVVAFATWWTASPLAVDVFDTELRSLMHSVNLISSGIFIFIIRKEWFVEISRIGAAMIVLGMSLFLAVPNSTVQLISAVIVGISLGCVNTSILMPFVFVLNNTEKLYAVVGSNLLINLISFFQEVGKRDPKDSKRVLLSTVILAIALILTIFFKASHISIDTDDKSANIPEILPRVYITLGFNCAIAILCKGVGKGILNITAAASSSPVLMWYYMGGIIGCFVYIAVYAFSQKAFIWIGNITFSSIAMGLLFNAFTVQIPELAMVFAILMGIGSTGGMINMYYILGVIGKKYNSMRYLRFSVFFIGICGGVFGVVLGNLIERTNAFEVSIIASIISVSVMLLFLILSPLLSQTHYYNDWAKDSEKVEIDNEQIYMFKEYQLSKREIEVCKLLLQGYTLRQISAMLSIAYSTVNTYCTSAYRKLGINSRTELLILFKEYLIK